MTLKEAIKWRVAVSYFCLFSVNSLVTTIIAATVNVDWASLDRQSKVMVYLVVFANWSSTIMAYISSTAKKIEESGNPLDAVETKIESK